MRPRFSDWLLLFVSAAFTALGIFLMNVGSGPRAAFAVTVFFGACTLIAIWILVEKMGNRTGRGTTSVEIAGSRRIPMAKQRMAVVAIGMIAGGILMGLGTPELGKVWGVLCGIVVLGGLWLLGGLAIGKLGNQYICFEPEGLKMGDQTWSYLIRWENVQAVTTSEYQRNPAVLIALANPTQLLTDLVGHGDLKRPREKVMRMLGWNRQLAGCDVMIITSQYRLNANLLAQAVRTYATQPEKRAELAPRPLIEPIRRNGAVS